MDRPGSNGEPTLSPAENYRGFKDHFGIEVIRAERTDSNHQEQLARNKTRDAIRNGPNRNHIFGSDLLHRLDASSEEEHATKSHLIEKLRHRLELQIEKSTDLNDEVFIDELRAGLEFITNAPDVEIGDGTVTSTRRARELLTDASPYQIEGLIRKHSTESIAEIERRQPELEGLKSQFLAQIAEKHATGAFPITADEASDRLANVDIRFADPWLLTGSTAGYMYEDSEIYISLELEADELREHAYHEFIHAISGVKARVSLPADIESFEATPELAGYAESTLIKHGLRVPRGNLDSRTGRFHWLDEAVTETEALSLTGNAEGAYEDFRKVYDLLQTRVPHEVFLAAQLEDYTHESGQPMWGELQAQLAANFAPGILLTLDLIMKRESTAAALQYLELNFSAEPTA